MKSEYTGNLLLYPCPVVLVTSKDNTAENVFTVSWTGIASSHPEYITIAINLKRFSHSIIQKSKKFCVNIPNSNLINEVDYCGSISGRDADKFQLCKFTKTYYNSDYILINQCPVHLICDVTSIVKLGSHDLFIAKVSHKLIDSHLSNIYEDVDPIVYFRPNYYQICKEKLGYYGYTISENIDRQYQ